MQVSVRCRLPTKRLITKLGPQLLLSVPGVRSLTVLDPLALFRTTRWAPLRLRLSSLVNVTVLVTLIT